MTHAERMAVLRDVLLERGLPLSEVERIAAAMEPGSMVLNRARLTAWQRARSPLPVWRTGTGAIDPAARSPRFVAVPEADAALIRDIRRFVEGG